MHPMGCATALASIQAYEDDNIVENAAAMGKVLGKRLNELKEDHKSIGDVRGKGLFWGVELVKDQVKKTPFVTREEKFDPGMLKRVSAAAMDLGVYIVNFINVLIIAPPLITTEKEIDEGIQALDQVLKIADKEAM